MKKAVAYLRYSTIMQDALSLEGQQRAISSYAMKNDIDIVELYADEAMSGKTDKRPEFRRMIAELEDKGIDLVLVHKLDRFARNRYDAAVNKHAITGKGARLLAVDHPLGDSPEDQLMEGILEAMAEFYSLNLAKETMKGLRETAHKGNFTGGWVPLGYKIVDKKYVIVEEEAEIVRTIFHMIAGGSSLGDVLKSLNSKGLLTRQQKPFGKNSIHSILQNEKYIGNLVFNKIPKFVNGVRNNKITSPEDEIVRTEGAVPAIVDLETWTTVQKTLSQRKRGPREGATRMYLLSGLLYCSECGAAMIGHCSTKTNRKGEKIRYHYYECNRMLRTRSCNNRKRYAAATLEAAFWNILEHEIIEQYDRFIELLFEEVCNYQRSSRVQEKEILNRLRSINLKTERIIKAIEDGVDYASLSPKLMNYRLEKESLETQLKELKSTSPKITKDCIEQYIASLREELTSDLDDSVRQKILASCIGEAKIDVDKLYMGYKMRIDESSLKFGVGGGT